MNLRGVEKWGEKEIGGGFLGRSSRSEACTCTPPSPLMVLFRRLSVPMACYLSEEFSGLSCSNSRGLAPQSGAYSQSLCRLALFSSGLLTASPCLVPACKGRAEDKTHERSEQAPTRS